MTGLLGLTYQEALERFPEEKLVFQITGEKKEGNKKEEMRIIRVVFSEEKIYCTLADPDYPKGEAPSF